MWAELFQADGQEDRHDEANSRFSQFCERALKRNIKTQSFCSTSQPRSLAMFSSPASISVTNTLVNNDGGARKSEVWPTRCNNNPIKDLHYSGSRKWQRVYRSFMETVYTNLITVISSIPLESSRAILKTFHVQTLPDVRQGSVPKMFCNSNSTYVGMHPTTYETKTTESYLFTQHVCLLSMKIIHASLC